MIPELIGYADKLSVRPGERLRFMVSTDQPDYEAAIVRLIQADESPAGPGFKEEVVGQPAESRYRGRRQISYTGSYVRVADHPALALSSFTLQAWIYPTLVPGQSAQGIVGKWDAPRSAGFALLIGEQGDLQLRINDATLSTGKPLRAGEWAFVAATFDAETQHAVLIQQPLTGIASDPASAIVTRTPMAAPTVNAAPLVIGALALEPVTGNRFAPRGCFNGKIDAPRIFDRALDTDALERLRLDAAPEAVSRASLVAAWDFALEPSSSRVVDTGRYRLHGTAVNMPGRALTGHNWSGPEIDFKHAPASYGAIHFHDTDLDDAGWDADFDWQVPDNARSGYYAARLRGGGLEDHIPFFVLPKRGAAKRPIAFLAPTMTYIAYANQRVQTEDGTETGVTDRPVGSGPLDKYLNEHPEFGYGAYDRHSDTSGVMYSSRMRPVVTLRPKYRYWLTGSPRHLSADLYMIDWLEANGFDYDVITDEALHDEGRELIDGYRVVITGSHPEYWTSPMMAGLESYLDGGGRLMYLGGNGFYWITGVDPERPHMIEIRRGIAGSRDWSSHPGEMYLSTTGELGGLWRHRGKAPNQLVGIGFSGMGWDGTAGYYLRKPDSFDPRAAFIFEGIGENEPIGNFGLVLGGAAGDELDRAERSIGTPARVLVLAESTGHSPQLLPVIEDFGQINSTTMRTLHNTVHASMVYFEMPNGGAVFSVGSICWMGSLPHNGYDNNVSKITGNVLRRFQQP